MLYADLLGGGLRPMAAHRGHQVSLDRITHRFGDFAAVRGVSLDVAAGEIVGLLGPSGCGKSTLLRIVAGFIAQTEGRVAFDGQAVDHLSPRKRRVGIVFQNYALFPHMTVGENVAYGLQAQHWPRAEIATRVESMLDLVHMRDFAQRKPRQLSGGQQQRVALARCLAVDPQVLLLDEPFGALDKNLRLDMQIEVKRLQREYGITTILVTHDQEEALSMADRIAVMNGGAIEQVSTPTEIYDRPQTLFVNQFVGMTNLMAGTVVGSEGAGAIVRVGQGTQISVADSRGLRPGTSVTVSVRPEHLRVAHGAGDGALPGEVKAVLPLGAHVIYEVELAGGTLLKVSEARDTAAPVRQPGHRVELVPTSPRACHVFPAS
jgi:putative spermidine/putrescine transport system ATP-binding protein